MIRFYVDLSGLLVLFWGLPRPRGLGYHMPALRAWSVNAAARLSAVLARQTDMLLLTNALKLKDENSNAYVLVLGPQGPACDSPGRKDWKR